MTIQATAPQHLSPAKAKKKPAGPLKSGGTHHDDSNTNTTSNSSSTSSSSSDNHHRHSVTNRDDSTQLLIDRRLFAARTTKKLDLSMPRNSSSSTTTHSLTTCFQVFPRQIFVHEHMSGHHLRELWLTNHHLSVIPSEIAHFPQLRVLGVAGNALAAIPIEIAQLGALEALYLERNQLQDVAESVIFPRQLRELRLDHNELKTFPIQITKLRLLNRLGLSHNQLESVVPQVRRLSNLVELDLDHNLITMEGLPSGDLAKLQKLERLGLDGNRLRERPRCLVEMPNVSYVRLNGNRPPDLPGSDAAKEQGEDIVSKRHDGYYQTMAGYQPHKPAQDNNQRDADRRAQPHATPLDDMAPCREQNVVNALAYQTPVAFFSESEVPAPTALEIVVAAVKPHASFPHARDHRASSGIALLERHHSSTAPFPDDCLASGDDGQDPDDRRGENDTVNTSLKSDYAPMVPSPGVASSSHSRSGGDNDAKPRGTWYDTFCRYRVLEFTVSIIMMAVAGVLSFVSVYDREIPHIEVRISATNTVWARDPTINNKKHKEQVPMMVLAVGAVVTPIATNLLVNYVLPKFKRVRVIPHDTRDFLLSLTQSIGISQVLTQFMKNMTGRFRPSFYDMCKWDYSVIWDGKTNLCQDKHAEKEGRKSFPSGHASYAWCTLFLMTLYLMGRSRLNCENRDETTMRGARKTLKLFLCFLPTLVATWVAITRSIDNWHHYADILAGSIIGAFGAAFGYAYNYGSIFSWDSAGMPNQEFHTRRKRKNRELLEAQTHSSKSLDGEPPRSDASYTTAFAAHTGSNKLPTDVSIHIR